MPQIIPFEVMAIITIIWTCIAAFLIAPTMVWMKIKKHNADPESIKKDVTETVEKDIKDLQTAFESKIDSINIPEAPDIEGLREEMTAKIDSIEIPEVPDIDMKQFYEDFKTLLADDINELQDTIPIHVINALRSEEGQEVLLEAAKSGGKAVSGAIYREMGIDADKVRKGAHDAKQWYVDNIQNENSNNGNNKMIRAVKALFKQIYPEEDGEFIDEKIAFVQEMQILLAPSGQKATAGDYNLQHSSTRQQHPGPARLPSPMRR